MKEIKVEVDLEDIREIEWVTDEGHRDGFCPSCKMPHKHADACWIGKVLS